MEPPWSTCADLPDLLELTHDPKPGMELRSLRFIARARGPLTVDFGVSEVTPGRCTIVEVGFMSDVYVAVDEETGEEYWTYDEVWPVENIKLNVVGEEDDD